MMTKLPVYTLIIIQLDSEVLVNTPLPDLVSLLEMDCGQNLETRRNITHQQSSFDQRGRESCSFQSRWGRYQIPNMGVSVINQ